VVFRSPVVYKPYNGREAVSQVLGAVAQVFEDFRYVDHFEREGGAALFFKARVGDREVDGLDLLAYDDEGLVKELTVMVRPLSGILALAEEMRKRLEDS
jgi:hypothetical protein